jgi:vesicle coat complex subunit
MPNVQKDETKDDYLKRCMSDNEMNTKYPEQDQRFAICNVYWEEHLMDGYSNFCDFVKRNENTDTNGKT